MFNIGPYGSASSDFLKKVIKSKNKRKEDITPPFYKDRIIKFNNDLMQPYSNYDVSFQSNTIYTLISDPKFHQKAIKNDLLDLYKYSSKPFVELRNELVKLPNNRSFDTCQYCAINSINTLDHILPKEKFPEFVVHPKNLFPACSLCNGKKSTKFLNRGIPEFLNLYIHKLPQVQYLFVEIILDKNTFNLRFYLKNINSIDPNIFAIIENHYSNLDLLSRYEKQANSIISIFEDTILSNLGSQTLDELLQMCINSLPAYRKTLGYNHYKIILEEELCTGSAFRDYLKLQGIT